MHPKRKLSGRWTVPTCLLLLLLGQFSARGEALEYLIEIQTNAIVSGESSPAPQAVIVGALRKRVQGLGGGDVLPVGPNRLQVRLFNLREEDKLIARQTLQRTGQLEFRLVHPQSDELLAQGLTEPGYQVLRQKERGSDGRELIIPLLVKKKAERGLSGNHIARTLVTRGNLGEPEINFELNREGAALFAEVTRDNLGRRLAIVLDGELYSAPVIRAEISGGRGIITGRFEIMEAVALASVLESPFAASLKILEEKPVDPAIEQAYRRKLWLKPLLLAAGALAIIGLVLGGIFYLIIRCFRSKGTSGPRAIPSTSTPPPLPGSP